MPSDINSLLKSKGIISPSSDKKETVPLLSALILYYRSILVNVIYQLFPTSLTQSIHEILIQTIHEYYKLEYQPQ